MRSVNKFLVLMICVLQPNPGFANSDESASNGINLQLEMAVPDDKPSIANLLRSQPENLSGLTVLRRADFFANTETARHAKLEAIDKFSRDESTWVFEVQSRGCTRVKDFVLLVQYEDSIAQSDTKLFGSGVEPREESRLSVSLWRLRPDRCRRKPRNIPLTLSLESVNRR